jgi:transketolase C-terminal domain/subunit
VAEVLAEGGGSGGRRVPFRRIGVPSAFSERVGSQRWLEQQHGLDEAGVLARVEALLDGR